MASFDDFIQQGQQLSNVFNGPSKPDKKFMKGLWDASEGGDPSERVDRAISQLMSALERGEVPAEGAHGAGGGGGDHSPKKPAPPTAGSFSISGPPSTGGKKDKKDKKDKKEKEGKDDNEKQEKKEKKDKKEKKNKKRKAEALEAVGTTEQPADLVAATEQPPAPASVADVLQEPPQADAEIAEQGDIMKDFFAEALAFEEDVLPSEHLPSEHLPSEHLPSEDLVGAPSVASPAGEHLPQSRGAKKAKRRKGESQAQEEAEDKTNLTEKWSQVLETIKVKRPLLVYEQDSIPYIEDFIKQMHNMADLDIAEHAAGRPMLAKLSLVPKAVAIMQKYAFADVFVSSGGCEALARWLQPLPDGQLPNVHLRNEMTKCMMRLPINKEALASCKGALLGQIVTKLARNPLETVENRKRCGALVQKWVKQVLLKSDANFDLDAMAESHASAAKPQFERPPPETAESLAALEAASDLRMHPSIPVPDSRMFTVQPMPKAQPIRRDKIDKETVRGKLQDALNLLCRPNKRAWKPYDVCIAGRTMNAI